MQIDLIVRCAPEGGQVVEYVYEDALALKAWLNTYLPDRVPVVSPVDAQTPPQVPEMHPMGADSTSDVEVPPSLKKPSLALQTPPEQIPQG